MFLFYSDMNETQITGEDDMYKITKDKLTFILFLVGMSLSLSTILNGYQIMSNWIQKYESQDGISKYNAYINIYSTTGATEYKLNDI